MNLKDSSVRFSGGRRNCLLVLGMHRSGTSAITRILSLMGAALPQNIMGAGIGNESGHWEPQRLVDLHDRMLAEAGSSWDDWRAFDTTWLPFARRRELAAETLDLLQAEYGDTPLMLIKDPRICRFAPKFIATLAEAGVETQVVLPVRNPLEVAASLQERDGMLQAKAALLWLRHVLDAEAATRGCLRAVISFEGLLADWRTSIERLTERLEIRWSYTHEEIAGQVARYLMPSQRHHAVNAERIQLDPMMRGWIAETYHALQVLEDNPAANSAFADLDRIGREFNHAAPVIFHYSAQYCAAAKGENNGLRAGLAQCEATLTDARQNAEALAEVAEQLKTLTSVLSEHGTSLQLFEQQPRLLTSQLTEAIEWAMNLKTILAERESELTATRAERDAQCEAMALKQAEAHQQELQRAATAKRTRNCGIAEGDRSMELLLQKCLMVIPSINGGDLLQRMLPTLRFPARQIAVLDQGSSDRTSHVCAEAGVEVVQLGVPHTYTEACNIGLSIAKERGCEYLLVANNDIVFRTDVARELLREMENDPHLGIVAPTQLIVDSQSGKEHLAYRVFWDLTSMRFEHDFQVPSPATKRLESDYCELTLALVRISATERVGFLDNEFGFYFEDADFGFRLRQAGYSCAYLTNSQIVHYHSSTFRKEAEERKQWYIKKNKALFAAKHKGLAVGHTDHGSSEASSWNIINIYLHKYLSRYGMIDSASPELIFSHPGEKPFDYLYSVWETTKLPEEWLQFARTYKLTLATSDWNASIFRSAGFTNVHYVPLGVETDTFHPWGEEQRCSSDLTFLWFSNNQHRKGLDIMLRAWEAFHAERDRPKLLLMGRGLEGAFSQQADATHRTDKFKISEYRDQGILIYEALETLSAEDLARLYRSVDFSISTSRSEGFGFTIAESMSCGTPVIFGDYGATREFKTPHALTFSGWPTKANYSDKGFGDVGSWFEPDVEELVGCLHAAFDLEQDDYNRLSLEGVQLIRSRFTWRNTIFALRSALQAVQLKLQVAQSNRDLAELTELRATAHIQPLIADVTDQKNQVVPHIQVVHDGRYSTRQFTARSLRRAGFVLTRCSESLESEGPRAAFSLGASMVARYLRTRARWAGQRVAVKTRVKKEFIGRTIGPQVSVPASNGTLFIGYVEAGLGLGENLRSLIKAYATQRLPFAIYPYNVAVEQRRVGPFMADKYEVENPHPVNIIYVATDQLPNLFSTVPKKLYEKSYNILRTYWELPSAPEAWKPMLHNIDEIWAPNEFVGNAFRRIFDGPITVIQPCVNVNLDCALPGRDRFGLQLGRFYYVFSFDYYSSPYRKNPLGVLAAFLEAFPDMSENVGLVIKSIGSKDHHPDIKDALNSAAASDPRITIVDQNLSREEILGLIRSCDCYVSLHRSEGFGLGMVEAMRFGKAVIGTKFSGSTDFLQEDISYPVPFSLREVKAYEYPWSEGQSWAEPDHAAAVSIFREVYRNSEERMRRCSAAKEFADSRYSEQAVGQLVASRLKAIKKATQ